MDKKEKYVEWSKLFHRCAEIVDEMIKSEDEEHELELKVKLVLTLFELKGAL